MESNRHHPLRKNRCYDFRLTPEEKEKLAANGVVASQRMEAESFGGVYHRLYSDVLPVFVTADSILHAWHRSFDAFLIRLETTHLLPTLEDILSSSLTECEAMLSDEKEENSMVSTAVGNVVEYLTIGLSLLRGTLQKKTPRLEALWAAIHAEVTSTTEMLGSQRTIDFSLFKRRGHYTKSKSSSATSVR
ncbi:hypothetical protein PHYSODRAFT_294932 [Phytophthora sojae]|uniref:Uncharacterized protein n=1 Tax=Phytophthora sojae (strain P6497) TaxID=1094619 RepID=G4YL87_PHYSP|nr:hypothetical protein PHYSODRAFT_294932 [Phytophthora sojae]EGZ30002.1 hypothetical protein PHYSODRAFT_294932 [Phytophthora sojae]|eukprot:XP_009517277.1 hypothetical protein PHYSODRAFT_294932 [Phytophthora sojae]